MELQHQPFDLYPRPTRSAPPAAARRLERLTRAAAAHGWDTNTHITQPDPDQPPTRIETIATHPEIPGTVHVRWDIGNNNCRMTVCRAPLGRKGRAVNTTYRQALLALASSRTLSRGLGDPQTA